MARMDAGYTPSVFPPVRNVDELREVVQRELERLGRVLQERTHVVLIPIHVEPDKVTDGLIVYADGTNWDPGSGAGVYQFRSGTWEFLG